METRKMTESAMLSALFVVISLFAMGTGIMYGIYLDIVVPIIIALISLRCNRKYTILSLATSLIIIMLIIGDVGAGIWMSQSMILGVVCGVFILRDTTVIDDLFYASVVSCFIMVIIDILFSGVLGFSFMKEFEGYLKYIPSNARLKEVIFYILIAALPVGTIFTTYIGALLLGNKLKLLNKNAKFKYKILTKGKRYWSYLCCSEKTMDRAVVFLIIIEILEYFYKLKHPYIKAIIISIKYIVLYCVIKDSLAFLRRYIYMKTQSILLDLIIAFGVVYLFTKTFKVISTILIIANFIINKMFNIREKQITALKEI